MKNDEDTSPETPKAKTRLSIHQTVRLVDIIESFGKQLQDLTRQVTYLLIKYDHANPSVYNQIANEKRTETNLLIEEFKSSLEETEDRPSQSIIVNLSTKKTDHPTKPPISKLTTIVSVTTAIITGIVLALREILK